MLAHGFHREMLAGLVQAGLATVVTETMRAGAAPIKVERYRITDNGRDALAITDPRERIGTVAQAANRCRITPRDRPRRRREPEIPPP
jgi:hypothetical protein